MKTELVRVCATDEITPGNSRLFEVSGYDILICNVGGKFFAVENVCSHDDGPLGEGTLHGCEIECPRHGARFNVKNGQVTKMPAVAEIESFPVQVKNNSIYIEIEN